MKDKPKLSLLVSVIFISMGLAVSSSIAAGNFTHLRKGSYNVLFSPEDSSRNQDAFPTLQTASTLSSTEITSATEVTEEIEALARGLMYDKRLIFKFVRNHIDYTHYYGCKKGATLTLLERSGNDFDQSALLIALLRASGYAAEFQKGRMKIPTSEMISWLGISDVDALGTHISSGGSPNTLRYIDVEGNILDFEFPRVWVVLADGEVNYKLDPAFKRYEEISGFNDIAATIGYNQTSFIGDAGGTTDTSWVKGLVFDEVSRNLGAYAENLIHHIATNANGASVEQVVSGRKIIQKEFDVLPTELSFPIVEAVQTWSEIPGSHGLTLRIEMGPINDEETEVDGETKIVRVFNVEVDERIFFADLGGRRLSLTFSENRGVISLDGIPIFEESGDPEEGKLGLRFSVTHPSFLGTYEYPYESYDRNGIYSIIYAFSPHKASVEARQQKLAAYLRHDPSGESPEVIAETLNVMGVSWMWQTHLANRIIDQLFDVTTISHHRFGRTGQEAGFYIDVGYQLFGPLSKTQDPAAPSLVFRLNAYFQSALEHSIIEQLQGAEYEAASTIKLLYEANELNQKIFLADKDNWSSIKAQWGGVVA
ncbi:MAG: transglutaminase domain-containing protein [Opitutales bacterium]|nr:transglutaminase domain-containing protein [Opitutales bacterium]